MEWRAKIGRWNNKNLLYFYATLALDNYLSDQFLGLHPWRQLLGVYGCGVIRADEVKRILSRVCVKGLSLKSGVSPKQWGSAGCRVMRAEQCPEACRGWGGGYWLSDHPPNTNCLQHTGVLISGTQPLSLQVQPQRLAQIQNGSVCSNIPLSNRSNLVLDWDQVLWQYILTLHLITG